MTEAYVIKRATLSHRGRKRSNNEDFVALFEPVDDEDLRRRGRAYIVADGVGGAAKGERASEYAAQKVIYEYFSDPKDDVGSALRRAIRQAGNDIYHHASRAEGIERMATTLVVAVLRDGVLTVANVGDSRAYLVRNGEAKQISRDHTIAGELVRNGEMNEDEAMHLRGKNRLTRSLGGELDVQVDVFSETRLEIGDRVLLCSDGLSRYASIEDIARLAGDGEPDTISRRCVDFAIKQGGADNVSVAVIEVGAATGSPLAALQLDEMLTEPSLRPRRPRRRKLARWTKILVAVGGIGLLVLVWYLVAEGLNPMAPEVASSATAEVGFDRGTNVGSGGPIDSPSNTVPGPLGATLETPEAAEATAAPSEDAGIEALAEQLASSPAFITVDFSSSDVWEMPDEPWATSRVEGAGLYIIDNAADGRLTWGIGPPVGANDLLVEVTARFVTACIGTTDAYGLVARIGQSGNSGYALEVACNGSFRIRKFLEAGAELLLDWTEDEEIRVGADSHRVGLLLRGDMLYAFANSHLLGEVSDSAYDSGPVGLYSSSVETPKLEVRFEQLQIWRVE